jgi:hypothetical protein
MKTILIACLLVVSLVALAQAQFFRPAAVRRPVVIAPVRRPVVIVGKRQLFYPYYGGYYGGYYGFYKRGNDQMTRFGRQFYYPYASYYYPYLFYRSADQKPDVFERNAVRCVVMRNESAIISCKSPSSVIECPVTVEMSTFKEQSFEFFGLSRVSSMNYSSVLPESHEYLMNPRCTDNTKWLNSTQTCVDGKSRQDIKLCYSNRCSGVRVNDLDCFTDLSNLFSSSIHKLIVPIDGRQCDLFGYLNFA